jgi:hypothetical protein
MALTPMCEIIDFLEPCKNGARPRPNDNSCREAAIVFPALAGGSELSRQDLRAELTQGNGKLVSPRGSGSIMHPYRILHAI